jgi:hypothetical protein
MIGGSTGGGNLSLQHRVQIGFGFHPDSYQWVPGALSLEVKRPEREADHPPPSSAEVKNAWIYTSTPQYTFMAWCPVKKSTGTTLSLSFIDYLLGAGIDQWIVQGFGLDDRGFES